MKTRSLPNQHNTATFSDYITFIDDESGDPIDISTVDEIAVRVRWPQSNTTLLKATLTGGDLIETSEGTVQFTFTPDQMGALCAGNYEFGISITIDGVTAQTHLCPLPIIEGL